MSFTAEYLRNLKVHRENDYRLKLIDDYISQTKSNILVVAEKGDTKYQDSFHFTDDKQILYVKYIDTILYKLKTIFPDCKITYDYLLQLEDGSWTRSKPSDPKINYQYKQANITIDWS
jgi:hypothetical protein